MGGSVFTAYRFPARIRATQTCKPVENNYSCGMAWYDAGHEQYSIATNMTGTVVFRVVGWDNCMDDKLNNYAGSTSGSLAEDHLQVWP
jgi:hypothetical protein